MSERKAINKYYPPDYDPSKLPKAKKNTKLNINRVRLMLPFSMKCVLCNEYIAARRKFNARKEVTPEKYLEVKIIRFHIKCPRCNSELVFRTDPKLSGFEPVSGVVRNYVSKIGTEHIEMETEDQMLERLEKQEKENAEYQEQMQYRKKDPFWQPQKAPSSVLDNLEENLVKQQKEQEMLDHLTLLQAKAAKLQDTADADVAILRAQKKQAAQRSLDELVPVKRPRTDSNHQVASFGVPVLRTIKVNLSNFRKLKNTPVPALLAAATPSTKATAGVNLVERPALSGPAYRIDTRKQLCIAGEQYHADPGTAERKESAAETQPISEIQKAQPHTLFSAVLGNYSSDDECG